MQETDRSAGIKNEPAHLQSASVIKNEAKSTTQKKRPSIKPMYICGRCDSTKDGTRGNPEFIFFQRDSTLERVVGGVRARNADVPRGYRGKVIDICDVLLYLSEIICDVLELKIRIFFSFRKKKKTRVLGS